MRPAQFGDEARTEPVDRRVRIGDPFAEQRGGRAVAQEIEIIFHEHHRRAAGEEKRLGQWKFAAIGHAEHMSEGQLGGAVLQRGHHLHELSVEAIVRGVKGGLQARFTAPMRNPLEQFLAGQDEILLVIHILGKILGDPLDEFPVTGGKKFLLMRGAHSEIDKVGERFLAVTGARPANNEFHLQHLQAGIGILRDWRGHGPDGGAWGVEVICRRWEHPVFQLGENGTLAFGFLDLVEAIKIRMPGKFRGHLATRAEEHYRQRL